MAAGPFTPYNNFLVQLGASRHSYLNNNVVAILLNNNYVPDPQHKALSDVSTYEVPSTGGYSRQSLTTKTVTELPNGNTKFNCDNIMFGANVSITARFAVLVDVTPTSPSDQTLLMYVDLNQGGTQPVQSLNSTFALDMNPEGLYQIKPTP